MQATPIDPRDQTHEVDDPSYRVFFWDSSSSSDEWELTEATWTRCSVGSTSTLSSAPTAYGPSSGPTTTSPTSVYVASIHPRRPLCGRRGPSRARP